MNRNKTLAKAPQTQDISLCQTLTNALLCLAIVIWALSISAWTQVKAHEDSRISQTIVKKAAIRAPVGCSGIPSCGEDISLEQARANYDEVKSRSTSFVTVTDHNICDADTIGPYFWAPMERFRDGRAALKTLQDRAQSGRPFGDYVIVEPDNSKDSEQHLALCSVSRISKAVGPPRECVTVAIITPSEVWLRGVDRDRFGCLTGATFRDSGAIDITFHVNTRMDPMKIVTSLLNTLQNNFGLSVVQRTSKSSSGKILHSYIKSSSMLHDSRILPSWRESLDFDLSIFPGETSIAIEGTAHAMVCRYALGNIINYTGLSDAQRGQYASALDSGVSSAIKAVCNNYRQQDAKTIICDR